MPSHDTAAQRVGTRWLKARYVAYTDASYAVAVVVPDTEGHRGLAGRFSAPRWATACA